MTVIKHREQRIGIFIDVQNLYHSAKNLFNARVNFKEILKRAVAYVIKTESGEEQPFFEALIRLGIETKIKELQIFIGGLKKADWDVGLAIDAVRLAPSLDVIVLMSGDGDFVPLVEYLRNQGKQVEVIAFGKTASSRLKEASDDFLDLSEDQQKFLIRPKIR